MRALQFLTEPEPWPAPLADDAPLLLRNLASVPMALVDLDDPPLLADDWLVLDNRSATLFETADVRHFMPLFAIDERGVNLFAAPYAARPVHESESDLMPAASLDMGGSVTELPFLL